MTVEVRPIRDSDEAAWDRLFRNYIAFYEADVADDVIALTWLRTLAGADGMHGLIAIDADAGASVGLATVVFHRSTWSATWHCYLEDLYVDEAARGRGAGRALIEAVYAEADRRGASRTYWTTKAGNTTARLLYDALGTLTDFVQYRRTGGG